jgi:hypothetical protein
VTAGVVAVAEDAKTETDRLIAKVSRKSILMVVEQATLRIEDRWWETSVRLITIGL